ncbi:MAG: c-type cytochrome, partial [Acetobacteraceae bacterium]|nr:c-type cytochrome [Acetobacteraceae bacterium]
GRLDTPPLEASARGERRAGIAVGAALALTIVTIAVLTVISYASTHVVSAASGEPLHIRVRGYQWWWEVAYLDQVPSRSFLTANEIHVPVGTPVHVDLAAVDVIHSFWVPNIAGKQDLIPGRSNEITIQADTPGRYRGQCAEFCGLQHAHMAMLVVAEAPAEFERWRAQQLAPATASASQEQEQGRKVFEAKACAGCHAVRGTSASGTLGPDLTHVGGREYIAAGELPTTRGTLAAWIADPQGIKPGNNMPLVPLSADELRAVSAYLAALQ